MRHLGLCLLGVLTLTAARARAIDFEYGDVTGSFNNLLSVSAAVRVETTDQRLLGKRNVPGQQGICPDDCISFSGDPAPNQRLVDARGAFSGSNQDNGDLNYRPGDVTYSASLINSELNLGWKEFTLKLHGLAYLDPLNLNFNEYHPETLYQPRYTRRSGEARRRLGRSAELLDAYVANHFELADHSVNWTLGYQRLHWGESTLVALNSINEINPPNANLLHEPGTQIDDVFQPVPLFTAGIDLSEGLSAQAIYQLDWRPVVADPVGSFHSTNDITNGGHTLVIGLGQFAEDPQGLQRLPGIAGLVSDTSATTQVDAEHTGYPRSQGQYGAKLNWYAHDVNDGIEFGLYYLNYHSRLPLIGATEANRSCARDAQIPDNIYSVLLACDGFKANPAGGKEPLPVDTMRMRLEYPENIHMIGVSFNTTVGRWSLAGEYSFRPNLPVQIQLTDLVYSGVQQAFPAVDVVLGPAQILQLQGLLLGASQLSAGDAAAIARILGYYLAHPAVYTLPGADRAVPAYIDRYRAQHYAPGQLIHGYERLQVGQLDLTGIRAFPRSELPIGADQTILVVEAGFTQVYNMPPRAALQFDGAGPNRTHASPGADGTGSGGVPDASRLNPTQQRSGFADAFAWGYRLLLSADYNDVFLGLNLKPQLIWQHDVAGIGIVPSQNFVGGRMQWRTALQADRGGYSALLYWQDSTGGGSDNPLRDRGELGLTLSYKF